MLTDRQADVVYISDLLEGRFPNLVDGLRRVLADHEVLLRIIRGTRDIWCRDFMPIEVAPGEFVRFRYDPDYLRGYEGLKTLPGDIGLSPEVVWCVESEIVLDGGNVVRWGGRGIVTEKVFRENPGINKNDLSGKLRELLRVEEVIVIPREPFDVVGHADGVVRFLDDRLVAINDYSKVAPWYGRRLRSILRRAGLEWVELPIAPMRLAAATSLPPSAATPTSSWCEGWSSCRDSGGWKMTWRAGSSRTTRATWRSFRWTARISPARVEC